MEYKTYSQNWQYSKKYPNGAPIFFIDGRRVTLEKGFKLVKDGDIRGQQIERWFRENGYAL